MSYVKATETLDSSEERLIRFAAELFGWMKERAVSEPFRPEMSRFLAELALRADDLPEPAGTPEASLRMICTSNREVRARLQQVLRHAPLYMELSALTLPQFTMAGHYRHAAWLYLSPPVARRVAREQMTKLSCPPAEAEEFLETLERRVADQATVTRDGAPQAA